MDSKAAVLRETVTEDGLLEGPATFETIQVDEPTGEEVLVEIGAAGLCHTDVSIALGELEESHPLVMGHEGAGVVREVGPDVTSVEPGDHVVLGRIACGDCEFCRRGRSNLCSVRSQRRPQGLLRNGATRFSRDGEPYYHCHSVSSFSEYTVVTEEVAIKVTDELPLEQAALLGCGVFTGVGAVANTADVQTGSSVAIFGAGGVGLCALQAATLNGAADIVVVDPIAEKLDLAESLGATHTVDPSEIDPVEAIRDIMDGGTDYAFDVVGNPRVAEQAIASVRTTGTAVLVGTAPEGVHDIAVDLSSVVLGEKTILGSFNGSYNLSLAIPKLAKLAVQDKLSLDALISKTRPLDELNDAIADLETGTSIRQILIP